LVSEFGSYPSTILSKKHKPGNHLASSQPQNSGEEAQAAWLIVTAYPFLPPPTTTPDPWPAPPASERQAALAEPLQKWHLMLALSSPKESTVHGDHSPPAWIGPHAHHTLASRPSFASRMHGGGKFPPPVATDEHGLW
jgi:hypothetical protein